jgi:hypothetical protein
MHHPEKLLSLTDDVRRHHPYPLHSIGNALSPSGRSKRARLHRYTDGNSWRHGMQPFKIGGRRLHGRV